LMYSPGWHASFETVISIFRFGHPTGKMTTRVDPGRWYQTEEEQTSNSLLDCRRHERSEHNAEEQK
jgi:hypothetical protein